MRSVGIRQLKAHLSQHLKEVGAGASLAVTERGRVIATISPAGTQQGAAEMEWAGQIVADGKASWSGGKPRGATGADRATTKASVAQAVLEDRR